MVGKITYLSKTTIKDLYYDKHKQKNWIKRIIYETLKVSFSGPTFKLNWVFDVPNLTNFFDNTIRHSTIQEDLF